ncbi:MAG: nucleotide exchange factor GrpE [Lachnospiraceae bacterium]|nr:nucleotide exchange factor GrpE [Lachnospiraceae bacterium]
MSAGENEKAEAEETVKEEEKAENSSAAETSEQEAKAEETNEQQGTDETKEDSDTDGQENGKDSSTEEKRGFFKKKDKKDKRDEQIAELNDKVLRQMAEFDNYRRRTEKEKEASFDNGARAVVEKILPVIDNFERGLASLNEEEKTGAFATGMDKIYKQMLDTLSASGLKEIEALNAEFNPDLHNAVMHVEDDSVGENIVVEVFQKGYIYKDVVVRHAMVKVAN